MAKDWTGDFRMLTETDLLSTMSRSLISNSSMDKDHSWRYLAEIYFDNSKLSSDGTSPIRIKQTSKSEYDVDKNLPGTTRPININQMLSTQNANAPWLINVFKKKFHRSRKNKRENSSHTNTVTAGELLQKPISIDGTSGKWIVDEKDDVQPMAQDFDTLTFGQYNGSRAVSSADDSLHLKHYHFNFRSVCTPTVSSESFFVEHRSEVPSGIIDEKQEETFWVKTSDFPSVQEAETPSRPLAEQKILISDNSTMQTTSKRAKSASAATGSRKAVSNSTKRATSVKKKKKSKYYQERVLSPEELELREALRIIDLDNIGFFPPTELRKVLKEVGINSNDIDKIERCLPLDDDGHYSIDNLVKLFLY